MRRSSFFANTVLLSLSNIITGTLVFVFSMILSKELGTIGLGLYQLVMPLYAMLLTVSGGGVTVTLSKIAAEKNSSCRFQELNDTVKSVILFEMVWSIFVCAAVFIMSGFIAEHIIKDSRSIFPIIALCPAVIFISLSSAYKGAYYGLQKVLVPAVTDIIEKIVRITILYSSFKLIYALPIQYKVSAAVLSLAFGELTSLILFYSAYKRFIGTKLQGISPSFSPKLLAEVIKAAFPLMLNGLLSTAFASLSTLIIVNRLQFIGLSNSDSLSTLGKLQGMASNIAFYPAILINALNVILVPAISEDVSLKRHNLLQKRINAVLFLSMSAALSTCAVIYCIPSSLGDLFYNDVSLGGLLYIIMPSLPFMYAGSVSYAIMNGLGKQKYILFLSMLLSAVDVLILYTAIGVPSIGIRGYGIDLLITSSAGLLINMHIIKKSASIKYNYLFLFVLPFAAMMISSALLCALNASFHISTAAFIIITYATYIFIIAFPSYRLFTSGH